MSLTLQLDTSQIKNALLEEARAEGVDRVRADDSSGLDVDVELPAGVTIDSADLHVDVAGPFTVRTADWQVEDNYIHLAYDFNDKSILSVEDFVNKFPDSMVVTITGFTVGEDFTNEGHIEASARYSDSYDMFRRGDKSPSYFIPIDSFSAHDPATADYRREAIAPPTNEWYANSLIASVAPKTTSTETKAVTRTIVVVKPDTTEERIAQVANLTRTATTVNDNTTYGEWNTETLAAYIPPAIEGYTPSIAEVPELVVDGNSEDSAVTITYNKDEVPEASETSETLDTPTDPKAPAEPTKPATSEAAKAPVPAKTTLPATGDADKSNAAVAALLGAGSLAFIGSRKLRSGL